MSSEVSDDGFPGLSLVPASHWPRLDDNLSLVDDGDTCPRGGSKDASKVMKDLLPTLLSFLGSCPSDAEGRNSRHERHKIILGINSFYGNTPILYSQREDSPKCPNLTDGLERFFNTSISHFILFWNRIHCRCHNSVKLSPRRQISLSDTQSLGGENTAESGFWKIIGIWKFLAQCSVIMHWWMLHTSSENLSRQSNCTMRGWRWPGLVLLIFFISRYLHRIGVQRMFALISDSHRPF